MCKWLALGGSQVLGVVEAGGRDLEARGVIDWKRGIVTKTGYVMLEGRMGRRRPYIVYALPRRGRAPSLLDVHNAMAVAILVEGPVVEREARANLHWPRAGGSVALGAKILCSDWSDERLQRANRSWLDWLRLV